MIAGERHAKQPLAPRLIMRGGVVSSNLHLSRRRDDKYPLSYDFYGYNMKRWDGYTVHGIHLLPHIAQ